MSTFNSFEMWRTFRSHFSLFHLLIHSISSLNKPLPHLSYMFFCLLFLLWCRKTYAKISFDLYIYGYDEINQINDNITHFELVNSILFTDNITKTDRKKVFRTFYFWYFFQWFYLIVDSFSCILREKSNVHQIEAVIVLLSVSQEWSKPVSLSV